MYETERHKEPEIRRTDKIIQRHMPRDSETERQITYSDEGDRLGKETAAEGQMEI